MKNGTICRSTGKAQFMRKVLTLRSHLRRKVPIHIASGFYASENSELGLNPDVNA
jgi:hypothetical protein